MIIIICLILLTGVGIASGVYLKQQWDRTNYFESTTINGFDASEKEPEEMLPDPDGCLQCASDPYTGRRKRALMSATLAELGYRIDEVALRKSLEDVLGEQKSSIPVLLESLMNGNAFRVTVSFIYDETASRLAVNSAALKNARIVSVDAELKFDEAASNYYIQPEIKGTEFEDADLQKIVKDAVDVLVTKRDPQPDLTIAVPDSISQKTAGNAG